MPTTTLSFQLWSSRKDPSLRNQLHVLSSAGYPDVQPHHAQYDDPAALRALLDEFGLTAKSAHINYDMLAAGEFEKTIRAMRVIGTELVIMPWLPKPLIPTDRAGWAAIGSEMKTHLARFEDAGLRFAWHNHGEELTALPDGSFPIEHVLGDDLLWEIDIGWALSVGADPAHWLERYSGRVPAIHVKDVPVPGTNLEEDGQITIGKGTVGWDVLWSQCVAAGAVLMVAEHDQPLDYADFARGSIETMRKLQAAESSR
jgi:sugar phosphate isomerase/epimerase